MVVGAIVLIVAVLALRSPKSSSTRAGSDTRTRTVTSAPATSPAHGSSTPGGSSARGSSSATTTKTKTSSSAAGGSAVGSQPLVVLNNTTTPGLAHDAAQRFENGGWTVTSFANYSNDILSTCAYYDPTVTGAKAAAEALHRQYPTIRRVKERFSNLPPGPVVVVLTDDYSPG